MSTEIRINKRWTIGAGRPVMVIAEISANHGQSQARAMRLIQEAADAGADAVKFQLFTPDTITVDADNKYTRIKHPVWGGQTLYQLYERAYTPWKWFPKLKQKADDLGLLFFATAFDPTAVDFLEELGVDMHKIASFELNDLPLIRCAAKTRKPLLMSTGMAARDEIRAAVTTARKGGARGVGLFRCVSSYPADPAQMHLATIADMRKRFRCPVGLSDHTMGTAVATAAVTLGVTFVEKHFTLSRKLHTEDSFFSIEPAELRQLVKDIRTVEKAIGSVQYAGDHTESKSRIFRRSLFAVQDIEKGELITVLNVRSVRPAHGLAPDQMKHIVGRPAKVKIKKGTPMSMEKVA